MASLFRIENVVGATAAVVLVVVASSADYAHIISATDRTLIATHFQSKDKTNVGAVYSVNNSIVEPIAFAKPVSDEMTVDPKVSPQLLYPRILNLTATAGAATFIGGILAAIIHVEQLYVLAPLGLLIFSVAGAAARRIHPRTA